MPITISTITSLTATMKALKLALSLMPLTRIMVRMNVIRTAGRSKYDPVDTNPVWGHPPATSTFTQ